MKKTLLLWLSICIVGKEVKYHMNVERYNACVYCGTFCNFLSVYMFVLYCVVCSSTLEEIREYGEIIINSANMYLVNLLPKRFRLSASSQV